MADVSTLNAEQRDRAGKGVARAHRREGRIPAVIYGNKMEPVMISMEWAGAFEAALPDRILHPGFRDQGERREPRGAGP